MKRIYPDAQNPPKGCCMNYGNFILEFRGGKFAILADALCQYDLIFNVRQHRQETCLRTDNERRLLQVTIAPYKW